MTLERTLEPNTKTTDSPDKKVGTSIASEQGHFYDRKTGAAIYEVAMTSKSGMRPTNIGDARKLDLVPSVTYVLNCMAKPGLEAWKAKQLLEASLTLPRKQGENLDAYAKRVIEDSKAQGIAAADRGTQLHKAIEDYIRGTIAPEWKEHLIVLDKTLMQHGIDIHAGQPEHSFSASINGLFYGGKIDYHANHVYGIEQGILCDFKSKDKIEDKKQMVWDEHLMQLAAYGYGVFGVVTSKRDWKWDSFRALNVFVGCNDMEIRVFEHKPEDMERAFSMFQDILSFWSKKNRFGKYSK